MKITIEIDCTPEEARKYMGFPDVEPLQSAVMDKMQDRMMNTMSMLDPETLMKSWFPIGSEGIEQLQKMMFSAAMNAMEPGRKPSQTSARTKSGEKDPRSA